MWHWNEAFDTLDLLLDYMPPGKKKKSCARSLSVHTLASTLSLCIDFALRWRGSPWCLRWSQAEVTDNDQNNFYWEAEGEGVSRPPPSAASWLQLLSVTASLWIMQRSPALARSTLYASACACTWKREAKGLYEWSKPQLDEGQQQCRCSYTPLIYTCSITELTRNPMRLSYSAVIIQHFYV